MSTDLNFGSRLAEICGSHKPSEVQQTLNISYQSAKNYLNGRLPHAEILIQISDRTGCSIDWLLTGREKKFREPSAELATPLPAGRLEESVRKFVVEVINELNSANHPAHPKTIRLQTSDVMSEKVTDDALTLTGRRR